MSASRLMPRCLPLKRMSNSHDAIFETVDHILVSDQFNPASSLAIGEVSDVVYFNDHIALDRPEMSDHGVVMVRIRLYDRTGGAAALDLTTAPK